VFWCLVVVGFASCLGVTVLELLSTLPVIRRPVRASLAAHRSGPYWTPSGPRSCRLALPIDRSEEQAFFFAWSPNPAQSLECPPEARIPSSGSSPGQRRGALTPSVASNPGHSKRIRKTHTRLYIDERRSWPKPYRRGRYCPGMPKSLEVCWLKGEGRGYSDVFALGHGRSQPACRTARRRSALTRSPGRQRLPRMMMNAPAMHTRAPITSQRSGRAPSTRRSQTSDAAT
jgi:hypothetical protein